MLRKKIDQIVGQLAYVMYKKIYGIKDEPFRKIKIYLSDRDNQWNLAALSAKSKAEVIAEVILKTDEKVTLSSKNNQWNKLAINQLSLDSSMPQTVQMPNKANSGDA